MTLPKRAHDWLWMVPLLMLIAWIGARTLNLYALWKDEYWTLLFAGAEPYGPTSFVESLARILNPAYTDTNPPGYYLTYKLWGEIVGWTPYAGRALSMLLGVLSIAWLYRLGCDLHSRAAGVGAAVALGLCAFFTVFLHDMRSYPLYALVTVTSLWFYWQLITRRQMPNAWMQLGFVLSLAGLFYTHFFAGLTAFGIGLYHLLFVRKDVRWWKILILMLMAGVLVAPLLYQLYMVMGIIGMKNLLDQFVLSPVDIFVQLANRFSNGLWPLLLLLLWFAARARGRGVGFVWFMAIFVLVAALLLNWRFQTITHVRYIMTMWPLLALIVGIGGAYLLRKGIHPAPFFAVWAGVGLWYSFDYNFWPGVTDPFWHLPWLELEKEVRRELHPNDTLIFLMPDSPSQRWMHEPIGSYYLRDEGIEYYFLEAPSALGSEAYTEKVTQYLSGNTRVWIALDPGQDNGAVDFFEQLIDRNYITCETPSNNATLSLELWARDSRDELGIFTFDNGVVLTPLGAPPKVVNGNLSMLEGWTVAEEVPPNTYSVAVHVLDSAGALVAQADYSLPPTGSTCVPTDIPVNHLPPGDYQVVALVYNWSSGERSLITDPATNAENDQVALGSFTITGDRP
jgi:hypothetical protein